MVLIKAHCFKKGDTIMSLRKIIASVIAMSMLFSVGCGSKDPSSDSSEKKDSVAASTSLAASDTAKKMGVGLNLGNTMEAYDATNCEKISYEWIPTVGSNTPQDYETSWGAVVTTQEVIDGQRNS